MALCSNSESLVVSQQLRVCDARDDAGSAVQKAWAKLEPRIFVWVGGSFAQNSTSPPSSYGLRSAPGQ